MVSDGLGGPSWSQMALALSDLGEASSSFSHKLSLQPPQPPLPKPCHENPIHSKIFPVQS